MKRYAYSLALVTLASLALPIRAAAQVQVPVPPPERLCDTQWEDCRQPILDLINNETVGIDVAFWYMQDARYANALVNRFRAGIPIRVLVDTRANNTYLGNPGNLKTLADAGIPMREKFGEDVLHWKMMLFHGQNMVHFSKANFDPFEYVPETVNSNYDDEAVYFTNDDRIVNSFRRRFDDRWIDTSVFRNYANITAPLTRNYPLYTIDPAMSFSADDEDFTARWISRMDQENVGIDAIVFRVTEDRAVDAVNRAIARGVPVRLLVEPQEYRNPKRLLDAKEVDRLYMGGAQLRKRQHEGLTHEALILLHGLGEAVFGSANWTLASAQFQDEHNIFYAPSFGKPWFFSWFAEQFARKWADTTNYVPFEPLPPGTPVYSAPANGSSGIGTSVTLQWDGGNWSHFYDIYFGKTSNPPLLVGNVQLGAPDDGVIETYTINNLDPGTTYFWRIVDRTYAQMTATGPTWSFTTAGTGGGPANVPFGGTPWPIPGTIQAENFDEGGQFVAYFDTTAGNAFGAYRSTDVDIEPDSDGGAGFHVGKTKASEWLKYTVNVAAAGTYPLTMRVANVGAGATMHVEVDGVNKSGTVSIPDTGGWQLWVTLAPINIAFTAGAHVVRVSFDTVGSGGGVGNFNWFQFGSSSGTGTQPPPANTPFGGTPATLPGTVQFENFDNGGQGIAYNDTSAGNAYGAYRSTDVDIEPDSDGGPGFHVAKTKAGEWLKFTVNVTTSDSYGLSIRVANLGTGAQLHFEVDGVDKTGPIDLPNTGSWTTWTTIIAPSVALTAGSHVIRVSFDAAGTGGGVGNLNWFEFSTASTTAQNRPFGGAAASVPGIVQFENFDDGGEAIAYHDTSAGNLYAAYRSTDVDIESTTDTDGEFDVAKTKPGEWLLFTVNVTASGTFPLAMRVANVGTGARVHVEVDGVDATGPIAVPDTTGWATWKTVAAPNVALAAGSHEIRVSFDAAGPGGGVGNFNWFEIGS